LLFGRRHSAFDCLYERASDQDKGSQRGDDRAELLYQREEPWLVPKINRYLGLFKKRARRYCYNIATFRIEANGTFDKVFKPGNVCGRPFRGTLAIA
jgi:hypothetical protein